MKKVYKSSNKFSVAGVIVLALAVMLVGCAISPIYLKINEIMPLVYLTILMTFFTGVFLGIIAKLVIKKMKIRSVVAVVISVTIAFVGFTYFKWAMYDYMDYKMIAKEACEMEDISKDEYKEIVEEFTEQVEYAFDSYGEFYDSILEEDDYSVKMAFYEFPAFEVKLTSILTNPKILFGDIKTINEDGRWSYSSSSYSSLKDDDASLVKGPMLSIVWIAEILILLITACAGAISAVKVPFIEKENKFADKLENCFLFAPFNSKDVVKEVYENPAKLLEIPAYEKADKFADFVVGTVYHSADFTECYLSLKLSQTVQKGKQTQRKQSNLIDYLDISGQLTNDLFEHCHLSAPMNVSSYSQVDTTSSGIDEEMFN